MKRIFIFIILILLFVSCDKKFDTTSDEAYEKSFQEIKNSLSPEKQKKFEEAMKIIGFSAVGNPFQFASDPEKFGKKFYELVDGKTADEIIKKADEILKERKVKEKEQAKVEIVDLKTEIAELETKREECNQAKEKLKQFKILKSRFQYKEKPYTGVDPYIDLTVVNNTEHPVSYAWFEGTITSPNRTIPWVKDTFGKNIPGGLEPGEKASWEINMGWAMGSWRNAPKDRNDLILTVTTYKLEGADEKKLFDSEFSEWDESSLNQKKERLVELEKMLTEE